MFLIPFVIGCTGGGESYAEFTFEDVISIFQNTSEPSEQPAPPTAVNQTDIISIASFNIQVFGKTKASKPEVMATIVNIISQFDVVAIQEIRDKSGTAIVKLENMMDATGTNYDYVIGQRLGRTSSKEQYAYMYRTDTIEPMVCISMEDSFDKFHREPYMCSFKAKNGTFDFVLITIHTDPDEATDEIEALLTLALTEARDHFTNESDFIILGDLNADCTYFDESAYQNPIMNHWIIGNELDTNLAKSSCTYDRIIITNEANEDYTGNSGVFRFDTLYDLPYTEAKKVSDHYPVFGDFYITKDTD